MTPTDAARQLDLPPDASPARREARIQEIRTQLADKISRAPTPGLQERYRASLAAANAAYALLAATATTAATAPAPAPFPASAPAGSTHPAAHSARPGMRRALVLIALLAGVAGGFWFWSSRPAPATTATVGPGPVSGAAGASTGPADPPTAKPEAEKSEEQHQAEYWASRTPEQLLELGGATRARLQAAAVDFDERAAEALRLSRTSPQKPAVWRAERWAESQGFQAVAAHVRELLKEDLPPWAGLQRLKQLVDTGARAEAEALKPELTEPLVDADAALDRAWVLQYRLTPLQITSTPPGLTWTIETRYDGDNVLLVSGKTPFKGEVFVGSGEGIIRIQRPGSPEFVQRGDTFGRSPWNDVAAEADFTQPADRP